MKFIKYSQNIRINKIRLMECCSSYQCQVTPLQLTVNFDIRRSGEPSRLSLRKQWIFRLAFPNDIDMKSNIPSAISLFLILFNLYQFNGKVQFFSRHFMVGIECNRSFIFSHNLYRERLSILVGQIYLLTNLKAF